MAPPDPQKQGDDAGLSSRLIDLGLVDRDEPITEIVAKAIVSIADANVALDAPG
jgi:hypothetical protein